jgi:hypothetical protein
MVANDVIATTTKDIIYNEDYQHFEWKLSLENQRNQRQSLQIADRNMSIAYQLLIQNSPPYLVAMSWRHALEPLNFSVYDLFVHVDVIRECQ